MIKAYSRNIFLPVIILFLVINGACLIFDNWLDQNKIDHTVLLYANLILFVLTLITCSIHLKSVSNNNPHAFVRGVTLASFIKLMIIAISVIIYLIVSAETKSIYAIIIAMIFYVAYTILEVKGAL